MELCSIVTKKVCSLLNSLLVPWLPKLASHENTLEGILFYFILFIRIIIFFFI